MFTLSSLNFDTLSSYSVVDSDKFIVPTNGSTVPETMNDTNSSNNNKTLLQTPYCSDYQQYESMDLDWRSLPSLSPSSDEMASVSMELKTMDEPGSNDITTLQPLQVFEEPESDSTLQFVHPEVIQLVQPKPTFVFSLLPPTLPLLPLVEPLNLQPEVGQIKQKLPDFVVSQPPPPPTLQILEQQVDLLNLQPKVDQTDQPRLVAPAVCKSKRKAIQPEVGQTKQPLTVIRGCKRKAKQPKSEQPKPVLRRSCRQSAKPLVLKVHSITRSLTNPMEKLCGIIFGTGHRLVKLNNDTVTEEYLISQIKVNKVHIRSGKANSLAPMGVQGKLPTFYDCKLCPAIFTEHKELYKHESEAHKRFYCPKHRKVFLTPKDFEAHKADRTLHKRTDFTTENYLQRKPLRCLYCKTSPFSTKNNVDFVQHIFNQHPAEQTFNCLFCKNFFPFNYLQYLDRHIHEHHQEEIKDGGYYLWSCFRIEEPAHKVVMAVPMEYANLQIGNDQMSPEVIDLTEL